MLKPTPPAGAGADRLTVKVKLFVPVLPSSWEALLIERLGTGSSLRIVPWADEPVIEAPTMFVKLTENVSVGSMTVSPLTATGNAYDVLPAGMICPVRLLAT